MRRMLLLPPEVCRRARLFSRHIMRVNGAPIARAIRAKAGHTSARQSAADGEARLLIYTIALRDIADYYLSSAGQKFHSRFTGAARRILSLRLGRQQTARPPAMRADCRPAPPTLSCHANYFPLPFSSSCIYCASHDDNAALNLV